MNLETICEVLEAEILQDRMEEDGVSGGYTSDLLSDVMANAKAGDALITIQAHKNTVAVATLVNSPLIVVCNSRPVQDDMIEAAREEGIAIIRTTLNQFEVSGRLWSRFKTS